MTIRLNRVIKEFNIGLQTIVDFLTMKGYIVEATTNSKITEEQYELLCKEFKSDAVLKKLASKEKFSHTKIDDFLKYNKPLDTEEKINNLFELCSYKFRNIINEDLLKDIYKETVFNLHSYLKSAYEKYLEGINEKKKLKKKNKKKSKKKKMKKGKSSPSVFNKNEIVYKRIHIINTPM